MPDFDVVIIGSGMGGLVCGNYLVRSGMKVAIFEQHTRAGGYCCSFRRDGFTFDFGPFMTGGLGERGVLRKIFKELNILSKISFTRRDLCDDIIFPDLKFSSGGDGRRMRARLKRSFPGEAKGIDKFFDLIETGNFMYLDSFLRNKTFTRFLDEYFDNIQLKRLLHTLIAAFGTVPRDISAMGAIHCYKRFFLEGGCYIRGGMQKLTDILVENFKAEGGKIYFKSFVKKIIVRNKKAVGVVLKNGDRFMSKYVVSNADAKQTFFKLIGPDILPFRFTDSLKKMEVSFSAFFVFLGLNKKLSTMGMRRNIWYLYDFKRWDAPRAEFLNDNQYLILRSSSLLDDSLAPPGCDNLSIMRLSEFKSEAYWKKNKTRIAESFIKNAEKLLPGLSGSIVCRETATPFSFYKYTLNDQGAAGGWSLIPSQSGDLRLSPVTPIDNLLLAGHWTKPGLGVVNAARSGFFASKMIERNLRIK